MWNPLESSTLIHFGFRQITADVKWNLHGREKTEDATDATTKNLRSDRGMITKAFHKTRDRFIK